MSELDALVEAGETYEEEASTVETETEEETVEETEEVEETTEESEEETEDSATTAQDETKQAESSEDEPNWAKVAYLDEKRKRQDLEKRLEALERPKGEDERLSFDDDPDAAIQQLEKRAETKAFLRVIELSRDVMRDAKEDYDDMEKQFVELAKEDQSLIAKMQASANPAKFAYDTAKKHLFMQEVSDPVAYEAKVREKVLAELKAETAKKKPPSLTKTASAGGTKSSTGDESLGDILGR